MSRIRMRSIVCLSSANRFGVVHVLLNNAGVLHAGTAEQLTPAQWDQTFNINVRGVWLLSRGVLPLMRKNGGGSIINIASVLGINGARLRAAYAASKGAVVLLTKCMAIDHGHEKIRVNAICPSFIETDLTAAYIRNTPDPAAVRRERIAVHPSVVLANPKIWPGLPSIWPATNPVGRQARHTLSMAVIWRSDPSGAANIPGRPPV